MDTQREGKDIEGAIGLDGGDSFVHEDWTEVKTVLHAVDTRLPCSEVEV